MKNTWTHYATKTRFEQKGYFRKHCNGGSGRETNQTSRSNRLLKSRKKEEEIKSEMYGKIVQLNTPIIFIGDENETRLQCEIGRCARSEEWQEKPITQEPKKRIRSNGKSRKKTKVFIGQENEINEKS